MQKQELKATGIPTGLTADSQVRFLVTKTDTSMVSEHTIMTGTLQEVLEAAARDFLPELDEDEKEEREEEGLDPDYDLSTPEKCLQAIHERLEECAEDDPAITILDMSTLELVYSFGQSDC